jgi:hypothetical protein
VPSNFNDTTPAAPGGNVNVKWQTDGAGNDSAYVPTAVNTGGTNVQTANYTIISGDTGKNVVANDASALTFLLPAAPPSATFCVFVQNIGVGTLTLSPNGLTLDGSSSSLTILTGQGVYVSTNNTNYFTERGRPTGVIKPVVVFTAGVNTNAQILVSAALGIGVKFPATAPLSFANAKAAATASTVYTITKNGSSFATVTYAIAATTGTFTQASDSTFATSDIFEIDGPVTADATLAGVSITFVGLTT